MTDELEMAWKEVALIGLLPRHLFEGTEENHEELRLRNVVWLAFTDNSEERTLLCLQGRKVRVNTTFTEKHPFRRASIRYLHLEILVLTDLMSPRTFP